MKRIEATATVSSEGILTLHLPSDITPGQHKVVVEIDNQAEIGNKRNGGLHLPKHDLGPWPERLSLRREDMYGDDGR